MSESAFSQDDHRRQQQDAEAKLAHSIGVQDAEGNQLHGRERTEAVRNLRAEMKAAVQQAAPAPAANPPAPDKAAKPPDDLRIVINAPHKAVVRGNQVALTIAATAPAAGGADTVTIRTTPWQPIPGVTANTVAIEPYGQLLKQDLTRYTVTGRTNDFTLTETDYLLYLKMSYTAGVLSGVELMAGPEWAGYPDKILMTGSDTLADPYIVSETRLVVAYAKLTTDGTAPAGELTVLDGATPLKVVRCVYSSLALQLETVLGVTFEYPALAALIPVP